MFEKWSLNPLAMNVGSLVITGFENRSVNSVAVSEKKGKVSAAHEIQSQLL